MFKKLLIGFLFVTSSMLIFSQTNNDNDKISLPIVAPSTVLSTKATVALETAAALKIAALVYSVNSPSFLVYGGWNVAPFCKNSSGGPGKQPYAYVDLNDPNSKLLIAGLMQAFESNKTVQLFVTGVSNSGGIACKILFYSVF
jgi:hypothetical protein